MPDGHPGNPRKNATIARQGAIGTRSRVLTSNALEQTHDQRQLSFCRAICGRARADSQLLTQAINLSPKFLSLIRQDMLQHGGDEQIRNVPPPREHRQNITKRVSSDFSGPAAYESLRGRTANAIRANRNPISGPIGRNKGRKAGAAPSLPVGLMVAGPLRPAALHCDRPAPFSPAILETGEVDRAAVTAGEGRSIAIL